MTQKILIKYPIDIVVGITVIVVLKLVNLIANELLTVGIHWGLEVEALIDKNWPFMSSVTIRMSDNMDSYNEH